MPRNSDVVVSTDGCDVMLLIGIDRSLSGMTRCGPVSETSVGRFSERMHVEVGSNGHFHFGYYCSTLWDWMWKCVVSVELSVSGYSVVTTWNCNLVIEEALTRANTEKWGNSDNYYQVDVLCILLMLTVQAMSAILSIISLAIDHNVEPCMAVKS